MTVSNNDDHFKAQRRVASRRFRRHVPDGAVGLYVIFAFDYFFVAALI